MQIRPIGGVLANKNIKIKTKIMQATIVMSEKVYIVAKSIGADNLVKLGTNPNNKQVMAVFNHNRKRLESKKLSVIWSESDEVSKKEIGMKNSTNKKRLNASLDVKNLGIKKTKENNQLKHKRFTKRLVKQQRKIFPNNVFPETTTWIHFNKVGNVTYTP